MINRGQRLMMIIEGQTSDEWLNPSGFDEADLRAGVMDILSKKFTVNSLSIMPRTRVIVGYLGWPYRSEITITTTIAYARPEDPASIVANAFFQVGGSMPTVQVEGYGAPMKPGVDDSRQPAGGLFSGWTVPIIIALVAVTAVGVFVAKRG